MATGNPPPASLPILPPLANLRIANPDGTPTHEFLSFLQILYAAIQGNGGIIDIIIQNISTDISTGIGASTAEAERKAFYYQFLSPLLHPQEPSVRTLADGLSIPDIQRAPPLRDLSGSVLDSPILDSILGKSPVSWTPVLAGLTTPGTQTYATQVGYYVTIGPLVFYSFNVVLSALDGATAGQIIIDGLPFPCNARTGYQSPATIGAVSNITFSAGKSMLGGTVFTSVSYVLLRQAGSGVASSSVQPTNLAANSGITGSGFYFR